MKVRKQVLIKKVNASLIHHLEFEDEHEVSEIPFNQLVNPARFDVLLKYLYAKSYKHGYDLEFATEAYDEHLRVWNDMVEGDLTGKDSFAKYFSSFNELLENFSNDGFRQQETFLPVGSNNIIIDGAHRSAACLAYNCNPVVARFNHAEAVYDASFFQDRGLSQVYLDAAAVEYATISANSYIVSLFPVAVHKKNQVKKVLSDYGSIVCEKSVFLYHFGPVNALAQMYRDEHWLGSREQGWPGAHEHAKNKFAGGRPMQVYLYECCDLAQVNKAKEKIRTLFTLGNDSIHINDSHEETVRLAQQLFNENTIHLFNNGDLSKQDRVFYLHDIFKNDIKTNQLDIEKFCVDSSSVLALYGLREANDYDFLTFSDDKEVFSDPLINNHNHEVKHYGKKLGSLIFDPRQYLYYDGVKYSSLNTVLEMKKNRSEEKDRTDIKLAKSLIDKSKKQRPWTPLHGRVKTPLVGRIRRALIEHLPSPLLSFAKKLLSALRMLKGFVQRVPERLLFGDRKMDYQGFSLYFSAGTSLVTRIREGRIYEPEVTTAVIRVMRVFDKPVVLDIGANIGLMSLNILKYYSNAEIFAFEPGPHQRDLLLKTIKSNDLENQIKVIDTALSDLNGTSVFSVHSSVHASGDGFYDTKRAGKTRNITVKTQKLDDWWLFNGKPNVNFVKIDTEGSELLILKGAMSFLNQLKPILLLEINSINLKVYDYDHFDILTFLENIGYRLQTLAGSDVRADNLESQMEVFGEFLATPIKS